METDAPETFRGIFMHPLPLLNGKLPATTPLTSEQQGVIDLGGIKIVYGMHPLTAFSDDPGSGGYAATIDISSHQLSGNIWAAVSARYRQGRPDVTIGNISSTQIILLSDVSISGAYADWMVIGISS